MSPSPEIVETHEEAAASPVPPFVVRAPLEAWLDRAGIGTGTLQVERIGDGLSNATFLLRRGGERFVLRRPPRPPIAPATHDVLREAAIVRALESSGIPVPRVVATCDDPGLIGAPFFVMEWLSGTVLNAHLPESLAAAADRVGVAERLVDALVAIHRIDWRTSPLRGIGKPDGYLDRQLDRFGQLWQRHRTRPIPELDRVGRWLLDHRPPGGGDAVVHGDFRLANAMFAPRSPARLVAILDWEMATLGDPLVDLGLLAASWSQPGDPPTMFDAMCPVPAMDGFPSRDALLARYERGIGRSVGNLDWYRVFVLWKTAVIMEGHRHRAGTGRSPALPESDDVPQLARTAWRLAGASRYG